LLEKVRRQIWGEVLGVDLRPPERCVGEFAILRLDARPQILVAPFSMALTPT
jgi:hypothetical protein